MVVNLRHYLESVNLGEWGKSTRFHKAQLQFKQQCDTAIYMCIKCSTHNHSSWQEKTNQMCITNQRLQCENSSISIFTDVSTSYLKTYCGLGSDCCVEVCTQQCSSQFLRFDTLSWNDMAAHIPKGHTSWKLLPSTSAS